MNTYFKILSKGKISGKLDLDIRLRFGFLQCNGDIEEKPFKVFLIIIELYVFMILKKGKKYGATCTLC